MHSLRCRHAGASLDTIPVSPYLRLSDADFSRWSISLGGHRHQPSIPATCTSCSCGQHVQGSDIDHAVTCQKLTGSRRHDDWKHRQMSSPGSPHRHGGDTGQQTRVGGEGKGPRAITQQRRSDIRGAPRCAEEASSETKLPGVVREGDARRGRDLSAKSEHPLGARVTGRNNTDPEHTVHTTRVSHKKIARVITDKATQGRGEQSRQLTVKRFHALVDVTSTIFSATYKRI